MKASGTDLLAGYALDLALGDPQWLPHPVRALGRLAAGLERVWRRAGLPERAAGALFCASVVTAAALAARLTSPWANIYWIYSLLAVRDLDRHAAAVIAGLDRGDLGEARRRLSLIVGRDTGALDEGEILRATVETMAENLSDGVVAPLFYLGVAGAPGMAAYKAVNTLDSMVGYRNARYREFGWASARLDDLANFVPARLTAALVWVSAGMLGYDVRRSVAATLRDARRQPSPNSGYPEAAVAGALGVQLGGVNTYGGVVVRKAALGDAAVPITRETWRKTRALLYTASTLMAAAAALWLWRRR